jgi:hypothetical protein
MLLRLKDLRQGAALGNKPFGKIDLVRRVVDQSGGYRGLHLAERRGDNLTANCYWSGFAERARTFLFVMTGQVCEPVPPCLVH